MFTWNRNSFVTGESRRSAKASKTKKYHKHLNSTKSLFELLQVTSVSVTLIRKSLRNGLLWELQTSLVSWKHWEGLPNILTTGLGRSEPGKIDGQGKCSTSDFSGEHFRKVLLTVRKFLRYFSALFLHHLFQVWVIFQIKIQETQNFSVALKAFPFFTNLTLWSHYA